MYHVLSKPVTITITINYRLSTNQQINYFINNTITSCAMMDLGNKTNHPKVEVLYVVTKGQTLLLFLRPSFETMLRNRWVY